MIRDPFASLALLGQQIDGAARPLRQLDEALRPMREFAAKVSEITETIAAQARTVESSSEYRLYVRRQARERFAAAVANLGLRRRHLRRIDSPAIAVLPPVVSLELARPPDDITCFVVAQHSPPAAFVPALPGTAAAA